MTLARSCTGYRPILDAAKSFAGDKDAWCEQVEQALVSSPDLSAGVRSNESSEGDAATFRVVDDGLLQPRRVMQQVRTTSADRVRQHAANDSNAGTSRRCHGHGDGGVSAPAPRCSGGGACAGCSKRRTGDVEAAGLALPAALGDVRACNARPRVHLTASLPAENQSPVAAHRGQARCVVSPNEPARVRRDHAREPGGAYRGRRERGER